MARRIEGLDEVIASTNFKNPSRKKIHVRTISTVNANSEKNLPMKFSRRVFHNGPDF